MFFDPSTAYWRPTMPTFGRTGSGKWHIIGPDGCRYGQAFADDPDATPDETVTATDIVAYDPPDDSDGEQSLAAAIGRSFPRSRGQRQRLVLPGAITDSDAGLCDSCRSQLKTQQKRRARLITDLKRVTPFRDVALSSTEYDSPQVCYWCHAHETTLWTSDVLDCQVCPACGRLYNSPLGDPGPDDTPEEDVRPATPSEFVTPIVFGATLPEYDATELVGSNRPLIEVREKTKYATLKLDLERTGHAFTPAAIDAIRSVRTRYAEDVAEDASHQTAVTVDVGRTARSVTLEGVYPDDVVSVIGDCWEIMGDPDNWFRIGWSTHGRMYGPPVERSIPGDEPVGEAFPRLQTQSPDASVDTEALKQMTESGRYQRGERYYTSGAVTDIERVDDRVQATVQGSRPYDVRVTVEDGRYVDGRCSCQDDAVPCKHIVAAVLATGDVESSGSEQPIEDVVADAARDELEALLLDAAEEDISLRKRIYKELHE